MTFDELTNDVMIYRLGLCVCGKPEDLLHLIYDYIKFKEQNRILIQNIGISHAEWPAYCDQRAALKKQLLFKHQVALEYLLYYFLDSKNIFEHGTNVEHGWLNDQDFFEKLCDWKKMYDELEAEHKYE